MESSSRPRPYDGDGGTHRRHFSSARPPLPQDRSHHRQHQNLRPVAVAAAASAPPPPHSAPPPPSTAPLLPVAKSGGSGCGAASPKTAPRMLLRVKRWRGRGDATRRRGGGGVADAPDRIRFDIAGGDGGGEGGTGSGSIPDADRDGFSGAGGSKKRGRAAASAAASAEAEGDLSSRLQRSASIRDSGGGHSHPSPASAPSEEEGLYPERKRGRGVVFRRAARPQQPHGIGVGDEEVRECPGTEEEERTKREERSKWIRVVDVQLREDEDDDDDEGGKEGAGKGDAATTRRRSRSNTDDDECIGDGLAAASASSRPQKKRRKMALVMHSSRTVLESDFWSGEGGGKALPEGEGGPGSATSAPGGGKGGEKVGTEPNGDDYYYDFYCLEQEGGKAHREVRIGGKGIGQGRGGGEELGLGSGTEEKKVEPSLSSSPHSAYSSPSVSHMFPSAAPPFASRGQSLASVPPSAVRGPGHLSSLPSTAANANVDASAGAMKETADCAEDLPDLPPPVLPSCDDNDDGYEYDGFGVADGRGKGNIGAVDAPLTMELQGGVGYWNKCGELILEPAGAPGAWDRGGGEDLDVDENRMNDAAMEMENGGDDDSNDEGYEGNDYPDEESFGGDDDSDNENGGGGGGGAWGGGGAARRWYAPDEGSENCDDSSDEEEETRWKRDLRNRSVVLQPAGGSGLWEGRGVGVNGDEDGDGGGSRFGGINLGGSGGFGAGSGKDLHHFGGNDFSGGAGDDESSGFGFGFGFGRSEGRGAIAPSYVTPPPPGTEVVEAAVPLGRRRSTRATASTVPRRSGATFRSSGNGHGNGCAGRHGMSSDDDDGEYAGPVRGIAGNGCDEKKVTDREGEDVAYDPFYDDN